MELRKEHQEGTPIPALLANLPRSLSGLRILHYRRNGSIHLQWTLLNLNISSSTYGLAYKTFGWPGQITHALPPRLKIVLFPLPTHPAYLTCRDRRAPGT